MPLVCSRLVRVADFGSLYQKPRDEVQDISFRVALDRMGDLYASAVGTTMLCYKQIPPRPKKLDGKLTLVMKPSSSSLGAKDVEAALKEFGEVSVEMLLDGPGAIVTFATHELALEALETLRTDDDYESVYMCYNEWPYMKRGWCFFEYSVSSEIVRLLSSKAKMVHDIMLQTLKPKMFIIEDHAEEDQLVREQASDQLEESRGQIVNGITASRFTNKGDQKSVVQLYQTYAEEIADSVVKIIPSLQSMHVTSAGASLTQRTDSTTIPDVDATPALPFRYASPQLLFCRPAGGALGAIESTGSGLRLLSGKLCPWEKDALKPGSTTTDAFDLTFDVFSQLALPWRRPSTEWYDAQRLAVEKATEAAGAAKNKVEYVLSELSPATLVTQDIRRIRELDWRSYSEFALMDLVEIRQGGHVLQRSADIKRADAIEAAIKAAQNELEHFAKVRETPEKLQAKLDQLIQEEAGGGSQEE